MRCQKGGGMTSLTDAEELDLNDDNLKGEVDIEIVDYALEVNRLRVDSQQADTDTMRVLLQIVQHFTSVKDDLITNTTEEMTTTSETERGRELDPLEEDVFNASLKTLKILIEKITKKGGARD